MPKYKVLKRLELEPGAKPLEPGAPVTLTARAAKPLLAVSAIERAPAKRKAEGA